MTPPINPPLLRVGDYRVVFKIVGNEVWIFGIIHRKDVYEMQRILLI